MLLKRSQTVQPNDDHDSSLFPCSSAIRAPSTARRASSRSIPSYLTQQSQQYSTSGRMPRGLLSKPFRYASWRAAQGASGSGPRCCFIARAEMAPVCFVVMYQFGSRGHQVSPSGSVTVMLGTPGIGSGGSFVVGSSTHRQHSSSPLEGN